MGIGASRVQQVIWPGGIGKQAKFFVQLCPAGVKGSVSIPRYRSDRVFHSNPATPPIEPANAACSSGHQPAPLLVLAQRRHDLQSISLLGVCLQGAQGVIFRSLFFTPGKI